MRFLFGEYSDIILTIIGGFSILNIVFNTCIKTNVEIYHNEDMNNLYPVIEKIGEFNCEDILVKDLNDDLFQSVKAYSNTGKDITSYIKTKLTKLDDYTYTIEYILKYNNEFQIKRAKCHIEEDYNEDNV